MVTKHAKFRLGKDTLDAMARIAASIQRHRYKRITNADVIRWLVALHDPLNNPGVVPTREQAVAFPCVLKCPLPTPVPNTALTVCRFAITKASSPPRPW